MNKIKAGEMHKIKKKKIRWPTNEWTKISFGTSHKCFVHANCPIAYKIHEICQQILDMHYAQSVASFQSIVTKVQNQSSPVLDVELCLWN
jgi:hypothetical protein